MGTDAEAAPEPEPSKETANLVIPEKASSFSIHPGRLCMDQCFYCGGKFGLFDTPCHIAQMKSSERQRKVLDSEYPFVATWPMTVSLEREHITHLQLFSFGTADWRTHPGERFCNCTHAAVFTFRFIL